MAATVIVRDLKKRYAGTDAARGVSFEIEQGEVFGLIGRNGAGKTTTVECVIGLREPDGGTIEVCGIDARRHPREVKERIGAALQTTALQDKITPREALVLFASFYRRHAEPAELLTRFGLDDKADVTFDTLSGGQRQRLALALAFVNRPELVFLDEPTTGLDAKSRRDLHAEILQMKRDGHTVLLTTHDISEAEALCDRLAVIDRGRIVASGTTREIVGRAHGGGQTVLFATSQPCDPALLSDLPGASELSCDGTTGRFCTTRVTDSVTELLARLDARGLGLLELHVGNASLEEVFLQLTGSDR